MKGRKPNISHLRVFGCKCFIHNNGKNLIGKFDARSDNGIFLGYSTHNKAYRILSKRTMCVEESVHVIFDESSTMSNEDVLFSNTSAEEHAISEQEQVQETGSSDTTNREETETQVNSDERVDIDENQPDVNEEQERSTPILKEYKYQGSHPLENLLTDLSSGITTGSGNKNHYAHSAFLSIVEPKKISEALQDADWIIAMEEELHQFERSKV